MTAIISLSGKFVFDKEVKVEYLKKFKRIIEDFVKDGNKAVIVTGGGKINFMYNQAAKKIADISDEDFDLIGIACTKLNAHLLRSIFGRIAYDDVVKDPTRVPKTDRPVIVASGWKPGFSSDMDAVILAKHFKAKTLINLTNVDYVYDKDPRGHKDAKPLKELSWDGLQALVGTEWRPRLDMPFDPIAVKDAKKAGLQLNIINGNDLVSFRSALHNKPFKGTVVR
ncbi:MAG: UMP kinase [Nanoarchaeota archaeon]|nr:UMP kinase [Nanoarchaeota archaeon]